jgi:hypothetical protein
MNAGARLSSLTYGLAFLIAVCAAIVSALVGLMTLPWLLAGTLDGRWQAVLTFLVWLAFTAAQFQLFRVAPKRRDAGVVSLGAFYLLVSTSPALAFIYVISL